MARSGELTSLSSSLQEVTGRVTALAEQAAAIGDEPVAGELFAVERALRSALRRLQHLTYSA